MRARSVASEYMESRPTSALAMLRALAVTAAAATIALLGIVAMRSHFGTDEFNYAHAAWAIAQGQQPYRDFFLHHFPGSMQLGSLVFALWDDPRAMEALRWLMAPFWLAAAGAIVLLNRRHGPWPALLSLPLLGSLGAWVQYATQYRPDPIAIAFFLISLLLATGAGPRARERAFAAGVCFVLAAWSSQKVIIYGSPLILAWLVAAVQTRIAPGAPRLIPAPAQFALGVIAGAVPIALYLTITRNWAHWWAWCLYGGIVHETLYPARSPFISLRPTLRDDWHVLGLGLLGFLWMLRRLAKRTPGAALADPDVLLLACAVTTAISYLMQRAPYGWSLVAPLSFVALLAARALGGLVQLALPRPSPSATRVAIAAACIAVAFVQAPRSARAMLRTSRERAEQDTMLANVARLSAPTDAVYDNTGRYVARPHAHFFFWTDQSARIVHRDRLIREIPAAILARGVTMRIRDRRDEELPPVLRAFLRDHFVCVLGDVCLWGQSYHSLDRQGPRSFTAVRAAQYYVTPGSVLSSGRLQIDGVTVSRAVFTLARGEHPVSWTGASPAPGFSIVWLPRTGETLAPAPPTLSTIGRRPR